MKLKLNGKSGKHILIDKEDQEAILKHKWYFIPDSKSGHAYTKINKKTTYLHRFLMNSPSGKVVDHINGDGLDNRRKNLRVCDHSLNMANRNNHNKNSKSKHLGVSWHKKSNKWIVQVQRNKKNIYLGTFKNINEAIKTRNLIQ